MTNEQTWLLAKCQKHPAIESERKLVQRLYFYILGGVQRWGVLGRSASSWFKRSASSCRVDGGAPVDGAPAVWTELEQPRQQATSPPEVRVNKR